MNISPGALKVIISSLLVLLFFVPFYEIYVPGLTKSEGNWEDAYFYDSEINAIVFFPFYFFWAIYLFIKNKRALSIIENILVGLGGFYFLYGLMGISMLTPDLVSDYGMFISFFFFPLMLTLKSKLK